MYDSFAYQYVARALALVFLLVSAWLTPPVSHVNRVAMAEVITRAVEACEMMLPTGSTDNWSGAQSESGSLQWPFNTVLDYVAFSLLF